MAVSGLNGADYAASVQVIQSAQNRQRLQQQSALSSQAEERTAQSFAQSSRPENTKAAESMESRQEPSAADLMARISEQRSLEQSARDPRASAQSKAAAAYGQVASLSDRERLGSMLSFSVFA